MRRIVAGLMLPVLLLLSQVVTAPAATSGVLAPNQVCDGTDWSGYSAANPWRQVLAGKLVMSGKPAVQVTSNGIVDWSVDPYQSQVWRSNLMGLKWVADFYQKATGRLGIDPTIPTLSEKRWYLDQAMNYVAQYADALPVSSPKFAAERQIADGQRAMALVCLADQDKILNGSVRSWLIQLIDAELAVVIERQGNLVWNQTVEDMLPILTAGCVVDRADWLQLANTRLADTALAGIDEQGASVEQSLGYANYNLRLWSRVLDKYSRCGITPPGIIGTRLPLLAGFLTAGTTPYGTLEQIGDTFALPASYNSLPGDSSFTWAATRGVRGAAPPPLAIYNAGYVFYRPKGAFTDDYFTLRYGPARTYHGQRDGGSFTWWPNGTPLVVDLGYPGTGPGRITYQGMRYQNSVTAGRGGERLPESTSSTALSHRGVTWGQSFTLSQPDSWWRGDRTRDVGVLPDINTVIVRDIALSHTTPFAVTQRTHLAPGLVPRIEKDGSFSIYLGRTLKWRGYTFGSRARTASLVTDTLYRDANTTAKSTALALTATGTSTNLGLLLVPASATVVWKKATGGTSVSITVGRVTRTIVVATRGFR